MTGFMQAKFKDKVVIVTGQAFAPDGGWLVGEIGVFRLQGGIIG